MTVFCCSETDCNCEVIERILQLSAKAALWISSESREMFDNYPSDHLNISDEYNLMLLLSYNQCKYVR